MGSERWNFCQFDTGERFQPQCSGWVEWEIDDSASLTFGTFLLFLARETSQSTGTTVGLKDTRMSNQIKTFSQFSHGPSCQSYPWCLMSGEERKRARSE